jgi:hypothetical protein
MKQCMLHLKHVYRSLLHSTASAYCCHVLLPVQQLRSTRGCVS